MGASVFSGVSPVEDELPISVAQGQKNVPRGADVALFQLLLQPGQIQSHALEIVLLDPAVHDQLRKHQLLLRGQIHVVRRDGRCRLTGRMVSFPLYSKTAVWIPVRSKYPVFWKLRENVVCKLLKSCLLHLWL